MNAQSISFLTPYWSGSEMMRIHLESIRKFYPAAPILVSKREGDAVEMEGYRIGFGIQYWLEDCGYIDALLRLLDRCESEYVCILDHDTVLLSSLDPLLDGLIERHCDLIGIEERIRAPMGIPAQLTTAANGWMRFAPGYMDASFMMFNLREFIRRWGLRGIQGRHSSTLPNHEYHYGLCERLDRHKYLRPFHASKYGFGNLLKDGETAILWHQWYGSYRTRLVGIASQTTDTGAVETIAITARGEKAFISDYPNPDFSNLVPAWGPGLDIIADQRALANAKRTDLISRITRGWGRLRNWRNYGVRGILVRALLRLDRWWRLR